MAFEKDVLTTGEVAKLCNVAPRTVSKWFDSGALKGYRIPGSKDRRIPMNELVKFMKAHKIPMDGINSGQTRVLIVDDEKEIAQTLARVLSDQTSYDVQTATGAFSAGITCESFKPHVLLMDLHLDGAEGPDTIKLIRQTDSLQMTRVIAMSGKLTDGQAAGLRAQGFDAFLKKPFQVRQVVELVEQMTSVLQ